MADKRISQLIERTDIANNDVLPIVASGATTTNKVTVSTLQDWMQENLDVGVTSVGLSMPSAFTVSNSPVTTSGNISVSGAGTVSQYIRGDGSLADFPSISGGGSSVSYYLNGSVSQGTIGGVAYLEMNKTPILGAGTNFTINANGYIASFITDAGDPNLLLIPGGNWNFETYFQASSGGGSPSFYVELYKVNSGGTATLIASNSANPELIAFGTTTTAYFSSLAVPATVLTLTDRLALRYYVTHAGRTITMHTENSNLCQVITTFTTGLTALNGLTAQVQNFATGTSGTDFAISSASTTHTFNLPTASATNRGALSSADWSTFNSKQPAGNYVTLDTAQTITAQKTFTTSGGTDSVIITTTGAGFALDAIKAGNGEVIRVNKTSGTGNAMTVIGGNLEAPTIVKTGGTSSQFLKANGSVDSNTYLTTGTAASTYITIATPTTITGVKTFASLTLNLAAAGTSNATIFSNSSADQTSMAGVNFFGFNSNNNIYFNKGTTLNAGFLVFNNTAARTYTLPDASGTLALTSDLGSYVPYSGATSNVDLGSFVLSANNLTANGGLNAGRLELKHASNASLIKTGYFVLSPSSNNTTIHFGFSTGASTWKNFGFSSHLLTDNTITIFSLPSAGGTLAVTSDLGGYLPLTGGTLSGALNGTSLNFSGDVQSGTRIGAVNGTHSIIATPNSGGTTNRIETVGTLPLSLVSAAAITMAAGGTTPQITLTTSGAATFSNTLAVTGQAAFGTSVNTTHDVLIQGTTSNNTKNAFRIQNSSAASLFAVRNDGVIDLYNNTTVGGTLGVTGALNGTSGTFSGTLSAGQSTFTHADTPLRLNNAGGQFTQLDFQNNGTQKGAIWWNNSANSLNLFTGVTALTLASTGAATFSSSVTAAKGTFSAPSGQNGLVVNGVNSIYAQNIVAGTGTGTSFGLTISAGTNSSDTAFQIYNSAENAIRLLVRGDGNVGIGTASPAEKLDVVGGALAAGNGTIKTGITYSSLGLIGTFSNHDLGIISNGGERMRITSAGYLVLGGSSSVYGQAGRGTFEMNGSADNILAMRVGGSLAGYLYTNASSMELYSTNPLSFSTAGSERMRITSGGSFLIGHTAATYSEKALIQYAGTGNQGLHINQTGSTGANDKILFSNGNGIVGYIRTDGSATSYVTASDYRLKEDLQEINGLEKVSSLKVYNYQWKNSEDRMDGVLAHELAEVLPYAVSGEKDGEMMQGVDYSKIVPVLIKAIQELKAEIDSLKTK